MSKQSIVGRLSNGGSSRPASARVQCRPSAWRRNSLIRTWLFATLLSAGAIAQAAPTAAQTPEDGSKRRLEVAILVDRSPSMATEEKQKRLDDLTNRLIPAIDGLAQAAGVELWLSMANFGGEIGQRSPLRRYVAGSPTTSPTNKINDTDFRSPLNHIEATLGDPHQAAAIAKIGIIVTDARPASSDDTNWSAEKKEEYMLGLGADSVRLRSIRMASKGIEVFVIAAGDDPSDAKLWRKLLPKERYFSVASPPDLTGVIAAMLQHIQHRMAAEPPRDEASDGEADLPQPEDRDVPVQERQSETDQLPATTDPGVKTEVRRKPWLLLGLVTLVASTALALLARFRRSTHRWFRVNLPTISDEEECAVVEACAESGQGTTTVSGYREEDLLWLLLCLGLVPRTLCRWLWYSRCSEGWDKLEAGIIAGLLQSETAEVMEILDDRSPRLMALAIRATARRNPRIGQQLLATCARLRNTALPRIAAQVTMSCCEDPKGGGAAEVILESEKSGIPLEVQPAVAVPILSSRRWLALPWRRSRSQYREAIQKVYGAELRARLAWRDNDAAMQPGSDAAAKRLIQVIRELESAYKKMGVKVGQRAGAAKTTTAISEYYARLARLANAMLLNKKKTRVVTWENVELPSDLSPTSCVATVVQLLNYTLTWATAPEQKHLWETPNRDRLDPRRGEISQLIGDLRQQIPGWRSDFCLPTTVAAWIFSEWLARFKDPSDPEPARMVLLTPELPRIYDRNIAVRGFILPGNNAQLPNGGVHTRGFQNLQILPESPIEVVEPPAGTIRANNTISARADFQFQIKIADLGELKELIELPAVARDRHSCVIDMSPPAVHLRFPTTIGTASLSTAGNGSGSTSIGELAETMLQSAVSDLRKRKKGLLWIVTERIGLTDLQKYSNDTIVPVDGREYSSDPSFFLYQFRRDLEAVGEDGQLTRLIYVGNLRAAARIAAVVNYHAKQLVMGPLQSVHFELIEAGLFGIMRTSSNGRLNIDPEVLFQLDDFLQLDSDDVLGSLFSEIQTQIESDAVGAGQIYLSSLELRGIFEKAQASANTTLGKRWPRCGSDDESVLLALARCSERRGQDSDSEGKWDRLGTAEEAELITRSEIDEVLGGRIKDKVLTKILEKGGTWFTLHRGSRLGFRSRLEREYAIARLRTQEHQDSVGS